MDANPSPEDESEAETRALLADPEALAGLREAEEAIAAGDFVTGEEMAELMRERFRREGHAAS